MLDRYPHDLPEIKGKSTWLVLATGSSINAIKSAKYYVENLANVRVTVEEPFHFQHYEKVDVATDLVLGVSQSGDSTSTINAGRADAIASKLVPTMVIGRAGNPGHSESVVGTGFRGLCP